MHHPPWLALSPAILCKYLFGNFSPATWSECAAEHCKTLTGQRGHLAPGSGLSRVQLSIYILFWTCSFPTVSLTALGTGNGHISITKRRCVAPLMSTSSGGQELWLLLLGCLPSPCSRALSGADTGPQRGSGFHQRHCFSHQCTKRVMGESHDLGLLGQMATHPPGIPSHPWGSYQGNQEAFAFPTHPVSSSDSPAPPCHGWP